MVETGNRELHLLGEIAAVVEQKDYTYQEAISALSQLLNYYTSNGRLFLSSTSIMDIAQHRQRQYEKNAAAPDIGAAAKGQI